jgi:raffinose/stachyose/melibiose transport system substrate-binding protein
MKKMAILLVLVGAVILMAGCAGPQATVEVTRVVEGEAAEVTRVVTEQVEVEVTRVVEVEVTGEAPPAEKAKVTLWLPDSDRWLCTADNLIPEFNAQSTLAEVEVSTKANYGESVRPALVAGVGPDVFQTEGPDQAAEYAQAGLLFPLDGYVAAYDWGDTFAGWALDLGRAPDGNLYTLPSELETLVLYYNKTVFDEMGWTPPNTMDELVSLNAQVQEAGLIPLGGIGLACVGCSRWYIGEFFNSVAGPDTVYQALRGEIPWTDEPFVESIALLNDMVQAGDFMGSPEEFLAADWDGFTSAFANGDAVMNIEGTWFYGRQGDFFGPESGNDKEWAWVPMPTSTGEDIFTIGLGSTWSVNADVENPEAVGEFLNWYLSPEIQGRQFAECDTTPAPVAVTEEMMAGVDPRMAEIYAALNAASAAGNYGYTMWSFWPAKTNTFAQEEIQKVWTGDMTVEEYLDGFNATFAQEMADGELPALPPR